jgi:hypothetical protein
MLRLFDQFMGKTNVVTTLEFDDPTKNSIFIPLSFSCDSNDGFTDMYEGVKAEIASVQSSSSKIVFGVQIKLSGMLKGSDISLQFQGLDSYRQFLEDSSLIKPSVRLVI